MEKVITLRAQIRHDQETWKCITITGNSIRCNILESQLDTCFAGTVFSLYADVEAFAGKTKLSSQDDRVHHYSAIVRQTVEMQPENATFVPSEQPAPPLLLPDTRAGHYSSLNLDTLFTELHPTVTAKWQELGEALGIDEDLLDEIFTNNATDDECLRDALKQWLKIRPACEDLSDALQKIGESQLAELLHPTSFCALDHEDENSRVSVEDTIQTG